MDNAPKREPNIRDVWEGPQVQRMFAALESVSQAKLDLKVKEGRYDPRHVDKA